VFCGVSTAPDYSGHVDLFGEPKPAPSRKRKPKRRPTLPDALVCPSPSCNRIEGHDGPHQQLRERDFRVLREWNDVG
jgi:hypothetical protein